MDQRLLEEHEQICEGITKNRVKSGISQNELAKSKWSNVFNFIFLKIQSLKILKKLV